MSYSDMEFGRKDIHLEAKLVTVKAFMSIYQLRTEFPKSICTSRNVIVAVHKSAYHFPSIHKCIHEAVGGGGGDEPLTLALLHHS